MKEMVKVRYQSVICHEDEKVKDHCICDASHETSLTKEVWQLKHPNHGQMKIMINGNEMEMSYGISKLKMRLNEMVDVDYATMYGVLKLRAYLKKCQCQKDKLAIIYELYDRSALISKCYITISVINAPIS